jgi:hypothetical protein
VPGLAIRNPWLQGLRQGTGQVPGLIIRNPWLERLRQGIWNAWNDSEKPWLQGLKQGIWIMPGMAVRNPWLQGLRQGIWISGLPQNRHAAGPGCGIVAAAEPPHQQRGASALCTG